MNSHLFGSPTPSENDMYPHGAHSDEELDSNTLGASIPHAAPNPPGSSVKDTNKKNDIGGKNAEPTFLPGDKAIADACVYCSCNEWDDSDDEDSAEMGATTIDEVVAVRRREIRRRRYEQTRGMHTPSVSPDQSNHHHSNSSAMNTNDDNNNHSLIHRRQHTVVPGNATRMSAFEEARQKFEHKNPGIRASANELRRWCFMEAFPYKENNPAIGKLHQQIDIAIKMNIHSAACEIQRYYNKCIRHQIADGKHWCIESIVRFLMKNETVQTNFLTETVMLHAQHFRNTGLCNRVQIEDDDDDDDDNSYESNEPEDRRSGSVQTTISFDSGARSPRPDSPVRLTSRSQEARVKKPKRMRTKLMSNPAGTKTLATIIQMYMNLKKKR